MVNESYENGLRDGKIDAMQEVQRRQNDRIDHHDSRLRVQEKITYGLIGAIALMEFLPDIRALIG